jgi:hypothetical protein
MHVCFSCSVVSWHDAPAELLVFFRLPVMVHFCAVTPEAQWPLLLLLLQML